MGTPVPMLEPPFLSGVEPAPDAEFPVRVTRRARRKLFWHIVNAEHYTGGGVRFTLVEPAGAPHVEFCDVSELDRDDYRLSKFGRVPVAVAKAEEEALAGFVLDCRSFPPGPTTFFLKEGEGLASAPPTRGGCGCRWTASAGYSRSCSGRRVGSPRL